MLQELKNTFKTILHEQAFNIKDEEDYKLKNPRLSC